MWNAPKGASRGTLRRFKKMSAFLEVLTAMVRECQAAATRFSDEHAAQGLAVADEMRTLFLPHPASTSSVQAAARLLQLPTELVSVILSHLDTPDISCLAATCRSLWFDAPTAPPPPREIGLVEAELQRRAQARGACTPPLPFQERRARG